MVSDLIDAGGAGFRVADEDLLAAGLFGLGRVRPDERDGVEELVLLAVVGVLAGQAFDEIVVDEAGAENVIAFGEDEAHLLFGVRIEVDQAGGLGLDLHGVQQLAVHPKAEHDGLGVVGALARQAEADGVFAVELDAAVGLDGAGIDAADLACP